jgi:ABC-type Fe3+/spermidine/putrescine transport system ATPase subunit
MIEIKNLEYENRISKPVSFKIDEGEIVALLGPSGCGKSTVLDVLGGFLQGYTGDILHNNIDLKKLSPQKRQFALVPQSASLFDHLTVRKNIEYAISNTNNSDELLKLIKLEDKADSYPSELSGGQASRVSVARAIANNPKLLLMDEPFSALDEELRYPLATEIREIIKTTNASCLIVTHDKKEAKLIADKIVTL